ncbi:MAG: hypothetical protein JWN05_2387 [Arthrobacter sp.]|jgi:hypothetical protein|nr:hypothetical protein [Arthrobacter sp.]
MSLSVRNGFRCPLEARWALSAMAAKSRKEAAMKPGQFTQRSKRVRGPNQNLINASLSAPRTVLYPVGGDLSEPEPLAAPNR